MTDIRTIVSVENDRVVFDDGRWLESNHEADCCEHHWLDFTEAAKDGALVGMRLDLAGEFFRRVPEYGIELLSASPDRLPVRVPGYGRNNGYYGNQIDLVLRGREGMTLKRWDVTECQSEED